MNRPAVRLCNLLVPALLYLCVSARAAGPPADRFSSASDTTTFPVQIHDWLVYVPVEINGRHLQFVLDSGSSRTLVDSSHVKELGLKPSGSDTVQGAGQGRIPVDKLGTLTIGLPGLEMHFEEAGAIDFSGLRRDTGMSAYGLLGHPFLSRYAVTIDYEHQTMTVTAPEKFVPPSGAQPLSIEMRGKWPFVSGEVRPSEDVGIQDKFLIDSGSSDAVDHPVATKMESRQPTRTGVGLGTASTGSSATLWGFRLGQYLVRDVTVACCGATENTSRMLGGEILHRFTVTFDYPHNQMFLVPNRYYVDNKK